MPIFLQAGVYTGAIILTVILIFTHQGGCTKILTAVPNPKLMIFLPE